MLSGDNSILQKTTDSKAKTEKAQIIENAQTDILGQQTDNKSGNITKEQLATILNKYFTTTNPTAIPDEISNETDIPLITKDDKYTIMLSEIFNGKFSTQNNVVTLGEKYEDSWIGKQITYTADNGESNWIILGKDINGDVLITTINPLGSYTSKWGEEYVEEYDKDLQNVCGEYTGKIGVNNVAVKAARNITGTDIDRSVEISEGNEQIIYADGSDYWCAGVIIGGPTYSARFVGQTRYGGRSISHSQTLYAPGQYQGSTSRTCKLRPVVIISSETPWDDVKDLIGNYATYN